jgi:hypothetical protein
MQNSARSSKVTVSADGRGLVSQAGAVLLWETLRVTGLGRGLSAALEPWRAPRAVHDPGKIVAGLAAALALGGDCLADIAELREQPALAGPVASDPVVPGWSRRSRPTSRRRWRRSGPRGRRRGSGPGRWPEMPPPAATAARSSSTWMPLS